MSAEEEWFKGWFDSPYYDILYKHRDTNEAERFIDKLLAHLQPPTQSRMLDLACGTGRHSIYLASKGYDVTGIDLSKRSIDLALKSKTDGLEFYVHDIRHLFRTNYFQFVFNFFTSFGYFEQENDNIKVLRAAHMALVPGGIMVIDFLNATKVQQGTPGEFDKKIGEVDFKINNWCDGGFIKKDIKLDDHGKVLHFMERVQALKLDDFKGYFDKTGFKLKEVFGNYDLGAFDEANSDRLILVIEK